MKKEAVQNERDRIVNHKRVVTSNIDSPSFSVTILYDAEIRTRQVRKFEKKNDHEKKNL